MAVEFAQVVAGSEQQPLALGAVEPSQQQRNEFEEKTGLNFEQDVDSVVAAVMPKDGMANNPAGSFLILAKARYQASRLEALAVEHGAQVTEYQGHSRTCPACCCCCCNLRFETMV